MRSQCLPFGPAAHDRSVDFRSPLRRNDATNARTVQVLVEKLNSLAPEQRTEVAMRIVADTNTVLAGLLWQGMPRSAAKALFEHISWIKVRLAYSAFHQPVKSLGLKLSILFAGRIPQDVQHQRKRRRRLTATRVVEIVAGKRRAPVFQQAEQPALLHGRRTPSSGSFGCASDSSGADVPGSGVRVVISGSIGLVLS